MLQPIQQKLLKSINELFDSEVKIEFFRDFNNLQKENPKYQKAFAQGRVITLETSFEDDSVWTSEYIKNNFASLQPCEHFKNLIKHQIDGKSWRGLYLIPEVAYTEVENFFTAPFHPYIEKFQELMDRSLEAGLPIAWEQFHYEFINKLYPPEITVKEIKQTKILNFDTIAPFFSILVFGFSIALFALLCEVFYHDFLAELSGELLRRELQKFFRRKLKGKKARVKPARKGKN